MCQTQGTGTYLVLRSRIVLIPRARRSVSWSSGVASSKTGQYCETPPTRIHDRVQLTRSCRAVHEPFLHQPLPHPRQHSISFSPQIESHLRPRNTFTVCPTSRRLAMDVTLSTEPESPMVSDRLQTESEGNWRLGRGRDSGGCTMTVRCLGQSLRRNQLGRWLRPSRVAPGSLPQWV